MARSLPSPFSGLRAEGRTCPQAGEGGLCGVLLSEVMLGHGQESQGGRFGLFGVVGLRQCGQGHRVLAEASLPRERLWVTNVIKCRAVKEEKGRLVDRAPLAGEIKACRPWLEGELEILRPRIVVCLGTPAAHALIDRKLKLSEEHGRFQEGPQGVRLLATFHPAYVLRLRSVDADAHERTRQALVDDLKKVTAALQLME